jgi:predicted nuclease of predicted toxin-antitoxin system
MTLRLLIDVNLSKDWVPVLEQAGFDAIHCGKTGTYHGFRAVGDG